MNEHPILTVREASLTLGGHKLFANLSFQAEEGQLVGIAGESGSGKTSLLRAVLGFVPLQAGSIELCGIPLDENHADVLRREVAYVPQELQPPAASVAELLRLTHGLSLNRAGLERAAGGERAFYAPIFHELGLAPDIWETAASKLSGGQRGRILLAAALMLPKRLLLLDEPTSALDAETSFLVGRTLHRVCDQEHRAALIVSHDETLLAMCDNVVRIP